jgi:hypothetical protein
MSVTETGANTYTNGKAEIPGTIGAQKVIIVDGNLNVGPPSLIDGIATGSATAYVGDKTDRSGMASEEGNGSVGSVFEEKNGDGTDIISHIGEGPIKLVKGREVPKDADGKFYMTIEVLGANNTAALKARLSAAFKVVM